MWKRCALEGETAIRTVMSKDLSRERVLFEVTRGMVYSADYGRSKLRIPDTDTAQNKQQWANEGTKSEIESLARRLYRLECIGRSAIKARRRARGRGWRACLNRARKPTGLASHGNLAGSRAFILRSTPLCARAMPYLS